MLNTPYISVGRNLRAALARHDQQGQVGDHVEDEPEFYYALSLVVEEKPQVKKIEKIIIKRKQIINPKFIPSNVETVNSIEFTIEPTTSEQAKIKDIVLYPKPKGH